MTLRQTLWLILLAALWGGSFLLMRIAAPVLGPVLLVQLRVSLAAILLFPALLWRRSGNAVAGRLGQILVLGAINSALPFALLAYATVIVPAGFASILNATTPFWTALVGFVWLRQRLSMYQLIGLFIGFAGVGILISDRILHVPATLWGLQGLAIAAALVATLQYGLAANYTKRYLNDIKPVVLAATSLLAASFVLLPFTWWQTRNQSVDLSLLFNSSSLSSVGWSVLGLGAACTAFAYLIYFKLLTTLGPAKTITVTYLIPVFGMLWGALLLHEPITLTLLIGSLIVLLGVSFATNMFPLKSKH